MAKGELILVPFPFDDLSATKLRPALCLTDPIRVNRHIVIAFVTSRVPVDLLASDLMLSRNQPDFPTTGLSTTSIIRLHRVFTTSKARIQRYVGRLSARRQVEVNHKLRTLYGL